jgi:protoporphyrinogen oxidase
MTDNRGAARTMKEWLKRNFGPTLCNLFFYPFHELYTAGLCDRIAPQDSYKSPVNISDAITGAFGAAPPVGYNVTYVYPEKGLREFSQRLGSAVDLRLGKRVKQIDLATQTVVFEDGSEHVYGSLLSSLPLNQTMRMSGLMPQDREDPYSSVLVLNIGAVRGNKCPDDQWIYVPESTSGFHRVGFYSNVDRSFLPVSARKKGKRVSIYVERAFPGGLRPSESDVQRYEDKVVQELQDLGFIAETEVVDDTWIDVAYTWSWPGSNWKNNAIKTLETHNIFPIGRYARWTFQGIAASLRDGLLLGASFKR